MTPEEQEFVRQVATSASDVTAGGAEGISQAVGA
jgi:hypothetical protein